MIRTAMWAVGALVVAAFAALVAGPLMVRDLAYVARWWLR